MTSGAAAARYARALFDVARQERADLEGLHRQLADFVQLMASNATLARALTNPAVPVTKKRAVVDALLTRAPGMATTLGKMIRMLAERDRLGLLPQIALSFEARLMDYRRVVRAEVVTAMELPPDRIAMLKDGLAQATGREVQLATRVDPSILGGAVARLGSTVFDGSVTRQLERLKETLLAAAE
jgi:F-type H+-transporting ATPase subunit delta